MVRLFRLALGISQPILEDPGTVNRGARKKIGATNGYTNVNFWATFRRAEFFPLLPD